MKQNYRSDILRAAAAALKKRHKDIIDATSLANGTVADVMNGTGNPQLESVLAVADALQVDRSLVFSDPAKVPAIPTA